MIIDQKVLDLASEVTGTQVTDHMTAVRILLAVSREVEAGKKMLNLGPDDSLGEACMKLRDKVESLKKELESLKASTK